MYLQYDPSKDYLSFNRDQHPLEVRFRAALKELRFDKTAKRNKKQEMEIDFLVRQCRQYGFIFFPEMYIVPAIERLEEIVSKRAKTNNKEQKAS